MSSASENNEAHFQLLSRFPDGTNALCFPDANAELVLIQHQGLCSSVPLRKAGKKVILVDDVPTFDFDPMMRFETAYIPARRDLGSWFGESADKPGLAPAAFATAADTATDLLSQTKGRFSGVELVDLKSRFCNSQNQCTYMVGNRLLFRDSNHVTEDGARYALGNFRLPQL